jgi:hypothetical protein
LLKALFPKGPFLSGGGNKRPIYWLIVTIISAAGLFYAATSNAVYEATSPPFLNWHVLLRKAYSIVAFAMLGTLVARFPPPRGRFAVTTIALALYSAAIEWGQYLGGVREGLAWNSIDVACGGIGGALGSWIFGTCFRGRIGSR